MSCPHLPAELLDHIVDFLHDSSDALKNCCLASKPWIPRTRKHLFADIQFRTPKDLESWKAIFPDPFTSPAHYYAKTLFIGNYHAIEIAGAVERPWEVAFSRIVQLTVNIKRDAEWRRIPLAPFYGFSPVLKSLRMTSVVHTHSEIFDFSHSFPLLEDLSMKVPGYGTVTIIGGEDSIEHDDYYFLYHQPPTVRPSDSPLFTGSLGLELRAKIEPFTSSLLSLPGGLHFRKLDLKWHLEVDIFLTAALVKGCCLTLESLRFGTGTLELPWSAQIDLNGVPKLRDVEFSWWLHPRWVLATLRTVTRDHRALEQITLVVHSGLGLGDHQDVRLAVGETAYQEWLELDRLLAELCELHSFRLTVMYNLRRCPDGSKEKRRMTILLPEVMKRGMADLVGLYKQ